MKKFILSFIVCLCFVSIMKSQDIIVMRNGDEIKAKVLEITLDELKYKMFNNLDGPTIIVLKKDVFMVKYPNGTKQVFEEQNEANPEQQQQEELQNDPQAMYERGCNDAHFTYRGNGPKWGAAVTTAFYIFPGLITAIIESSVRPSPRNLNMDYNLINNKDYVTGYKDTAFRIKKRKTWNGFAIGGGIEVAIIILFSGLLRNL